MAIQQSEHDFESMNALRMRVGLLEKVNADLKARLEVLESRNGLRDFHAPFDTVEACNAGTCSYATGYLAAGPAELTHEAFHEAEAQAAAHYEQCAAPLGIPCWQCDKWERKTRA